MKRRFPREKIFEEVYKHVRVQSPTAVGAVPFSPNKIQREINTTSRVFAGDEVTEALLKPRQLGASTDIMAFMWGLAKEKPGIGMIVIMPSDKVAIELRTKWDILIDNTQVNPECGMITKTDNADKFAWENGSFISWFTVGGTMTVADAVGRCGTYAFAWFTEMAFPKEARLMSAAWSALRPALRTAHASIFLDSTPNGPTGPGRTYCEAIRMLDEGEIPGSVFFWPWWEVPKNRLPIPTSPEIFAASLTPEERGMAKRYGWSFSQIQFRREGMAGAPGQSKAQARRSFLDNNPEIREDVFAHADAGSLFDEDFIAELRTKARTGWAPPLTRAELLAAGIALPSPQDLMVKSDWGKPLDKIGHVRIYELPIPGDRYYMSGDCADGNPGSDWSGSSIHHESGRVVGKIMLRVSPTRFAAVVQRNALIFNNARLDIELQKGALAFDRIKRAMGGDILSGETFPGELDVLLEAYHRVRKVPTSATSRPEIIDAAYAAIYEGDAIKDDHSLLEIESLKRDASGKIVAGGGQHDDFFLAIGIGERARQFWLPREQNEAMKRTKRERKSSGGDAQRRPRARKVKRRR